MKLARPEWAGRIERLRARLGLSQSAFAQQLKVSAMAVSRWERGVNQPPTACYIGLGKLAGSPECWYFWERAGLSKQEVLTALASASDGAGGSHSRREGVRPRTK